jgi:NADH:ubiquinone oxidoreductase subunit 5 (subunit L)/multisubunit Na+/H+ antiporter MnhA subunit
MMPRATALAEFSSLVDKHAQAEKTVLQCNQERSPPSTASWKEWRLGKNGVLERMASWKECGESADTEAKMIFLFGLLAPLLWALLIPLFGAGKKQILGWLTLPAPLLTFGTMLYLFLKAPDGGFHYQLQWSEALGIHFGFSLDGLSALFALVVSGAGVLVTAYAATYMDNSQKDHHRFYSYLMLFMVVMCATVTQTNLMSLFLFWELTGITSFLLIGFKYGKEEAMRGARMALLTTASTGLVLLMGVVLIGKAAGTYDIAALTSMVRSGELSTQTPLMQSALICLFIGAAGKSAQFPFSYWLPNAMSAPTPVSAYLHSATMVKLGVFLMARLFPIFGGDTLWTILLVGIGFFTVFWGAVHSLLAQDLKGILAYSTVSHLGLLIGVYGVYGYGELYADSAQILGHVFYKGSLFMVAGIIDHTTGTRDLRRLGGLGKPLPVLFATSVLACMSLASLPFSFGFIGKEILLEDLLSPGPASALSPDRTGPLGLCALVALLTAAALKVSVATRFVWHLFVRPYPLANPDDAGGHASAAPVHHRPSLLFQMPALLLACASLFFGVFPRAFAPLMQAFALDGSHLDLERTERYLAIWHGPTPALGLSLVTIVSGVALFLLFERTKTWERLHAPALMQFDRAFDRLLKGLVEGASSVTRATQAEKHGTHLTVVMGVIAFSLLGFAWMNGSRLVSLSAVFQEVSNIQLSGTVLTRSFVCALTLCAALMALVFSNVLARLILTSMVGLLITVIYVLFQAPDLALTQMLVETVVLVALCVLLSRVKGSFFARQVPQLFRRRIASAFVAISMGLLVALLLTIVQLSRKDPSWYIGDHFLNVTKPLAAGTNAVNTILVDFRGTDTLFEITVLVIATLGCIGLLSRRVLKKGGSDVPG